MKCNQRFYVCKHCGNMIGMIFASGVPIICCGEPMTEMIAHDADEGYEKHIPVVKVDGDKVDVVVGSVEHPMTEAHFIEWIYLQTKNGGQRKALKAGDRPAVSFTLTDDAPVCVFAYCNLHGLWKADA